MVRFSTLFFIALFLLNTGCSYKRHITNQYDYNAKPELKLAILPVRYKLSGGIVSRYDAQKINKIQETQSLLFQSNLSERIVRKMGNGSFNVNVNLLDNIETNAILAKKGISILKSYDTSPIELGKILEVDVVMVVYINSNRLLSTTESKLVDLGTTILEGLSEGGLPFHNVPIGHDIVNGKILLVNKNNLLWAKKAIRKIRVHQTPDETIESIGRALARAFPFRNRDY